MKSEVSEKQRQREPGYWWHLRPSLLPALLVAWYSALFAGPYSPPTSPSLPAPRHREESRGILIHQLT